MIQRRKKRHDVISEVEEGENKREWSGVSPGRMRNAFNSLYGFTETFLSLARCLWRKENIFYPTLGCFNHTPACQIRRCSLKPQRKKAETELPQGRGNFKLNSGGIQIK